MYLVHIVSLIQQMFCLITIYIDCCQRRIRTSWSWIKMVEREFIIGDHLNCCCHLVAKFVHRKICTHSSNLHKEKCQYYKFWQICTYLPNLLPKNIHIATFWQICMHLPNLCKDKCLCCNYLANRNPNLIISTLENFLLNCGQLFNFCEKWSHLGLGCKVKTSVIVAN